MPEIRALTTGQRIQRLREARGMSRPVLAGLVGRSPDWLKKIESGNRQLTKLPLLVALARALSVTDVSLLTGDDTPRPVAAWDGEIHHVVPAIRDAMRDVSFPSVFPSNLSLLPAAELTARVHRLWLTWHAEPAQRTVVGAQLPALIRQAHESIQAHHDVERRRAQAAAGDLYRLVQRLLAHICEPELHAVAVERGRAMSESADSPMSLALAAWSSSVSLSASGHFDDAVRLADAGARTLAPLMEASSVDVLGTLGSLQLEAAAAHGLAGRAGDAFRYLDLAAHTASRLPRGASHPQSAFDPSNVEIIGVIISGSLHRTGEAIAHAERLDPAGIPSVVRRSRFLLEVAHVHSMRRQPREAVHYLHAAANVSTEAVALIPWARDLADALLTAAPGTARSSAEQLAVRLNSVGEALSA
jgi:transcriptional regulator with XRE-family HTH domain